MRSPGRVKIDAEGRNLAPLTDRLCREGVEVSDLKRGEGKKFSFFVRKKDLCKTFAILDELCYNYVTQGKSEFALLAFALIRRTALFVTIAVFAVLVSLSRTVVWRVEITGNDAVTEKVITNALEDAGVAVGKKTSSFDADKVNAALRSIDGVKMANSYLRGTTVKVKVYESDAVAPPLSSQDGDILSEYDATVTRIVAGEGTALVKVGQNVFAGTPLIGAFRAGQEGEEPVPSKAGGIVYGMVARTQTVTLASEIYERVPESRKVYTRVGIFGLWIGKRPKVASGSYSTTCVEKFSAFLPIKAERTVVTRTTAKKVERTLDELRERAEKQAYAEFIDTVTPIGGYTVSSVARDIGGGVYGISVFIEAETVIGSSRIR